MATTSAHMVALAALVLWKRFLPVWMLASILLFLRKD